MENKARQPLFASNSKATYVLCGVEFVFLLILLGSIDIVVGLVVSVCVVLVRLAVGGRISALKGWWRHTVWWLGILVVDFILIALGQAISYQLLLGAKAFTHIENLYGIGAVAGLLTGGLAAVDILTTAAIILVEFNRKKHVKNASNK